MNKTQKGFAVLEGLLLVIIVAVIGGIGWYAIHTKHQTDKILAQSEKTSQSTPQTSAKSNNTSTNQKYLTIKEWGVRIPYSGSDIFTYGLSEGSTNLIKVISKNLADTYGCIESGSGTIAKLNPSDDSSGTGISGAPTVEQDATQNPNLYGHVGNYYFKFIHDQSACSAKVAEGSSGQTAQSAANDALKVLIPKIQAIPQ